MKKEIKITIIILFIITLLFLGNTLRNYIIIKKINNRGNNIFSSNNYYITEKVTHLDGSNVMTEGYYKDNIIKINSYKNDILQSTFWENISTKEHTTVYAIENWMLSVDDAKYFERLKVQYLIDEYFNNLGFYMTHFIGTRNNNYKISTSMGYTRYFDKNTYDLTKAELLNQKSEKIEITNYTIITNVVTDKDIEKPEQI